MASDEDKIGEDRCRQALEDVRNDIFYWMTRNHPSRQADAYAKLGEIKERITKVLQS